MIGAIVLLLAVNCCIGNEEAWKTMYMNGHEWGTWGNEERCDAGKFAYAFQIKLNSSQANGDYETLNGIRLHCRAPAKNYTPRVGSNGSTEIVTSAVGQWGSWQSTTFCPEDGFITGATVRKEGKQANNVEFMCHGTYSPSGTMIRGSRVINVGEWGSLQTCSGGVVCGIRTSLQGGATVLGGVQFICCRLH